MQPGNTVNPIDAMASDWAAKSDRGLRPDESQALDAWLESDPRHPGAYARARAAAILLQRTLVLEGQGASRPVPAPGFSRRGLLWGGSAVAACAAGLTGVVLWNNRSTTISTQRGETRAVPLPDGSVANLNTETRVRFQVSEGRRQVWLEAGEAVFDIVAGQAPFRVAVGAFEVVSPAAQVMISHLSGRPMQVLVARGRVDLQRDGGKDRTTLLTHSLATWVDGRTPVVSTDLSALRIEQATLWQEGKIAFQDARLGAVAAEFARYSDVRIVIGDPRLAQEQVSGLFNARDPAGFARAVAPSLGLTVATRDREVRLDYVR